MSDYSLGRYFCENPHHALLHHVLETSSTRWGGKPHGAMEFGVGNGDSLRCIARYMPVIGFDWFFGLPEDWREGFPLGAFATGGPPDNLPPQAKIVSGLFENTLLCPPWEPGDLDWPLALAHIDCDLYSSTRDVLEGIEQLLQPGIVVCFDEWHGYQGCEEHEQRAWREFAERTGIQWNVIGHGVQQWAIEIT